MVNQSICRCTWCPFHTFENTKADNMQLINIKTVETNPDTLLHLRGITVLIINASSGNNTAASVNLMVRASMDCKNCSNCYCLVVMTTIGLGLFKFSFSESLSIKSTVFTFSISSNNFFMISNRLPSTTPPFIK